MSKLKADKETTDLIKNKTRLFQETMTKMLRNNGTIYLGLSGEGKVAFKNKDGIKQPFIQMRINPCPGSFYSDDSDECCAKDQMFDFLKSLEIVPLLDLPSNEKYVIDENQWLEVLNEIEQDLEDQTKNSWFKEIYCGDDCVITCCIKLLSNETILGLTMVNLNYDFVTTILKLENPSGKNNAFIFTKDNWKFKVKDNNGEPHLISNKNTDLFTNTIIPVINSTLLYNKETKRYAIIDSNDYLNPQ